MTIISSLVIRVAKTIFRGFIKSVKTEKIKYESALRMRDKLTSSAAAAAPPHTDLTAEIDEGPSVNEKINDEQNGSTQNNDFQELFTMNKEKSGVAERTSSESQDHQQLNNSKIEKIEINEAENEKTNKEISGLFSAENANDPDIVTKDLKLSDHLQGLGWQSIAISLAIRAILSLPIIAGVAEKASSESQDHQQLNNSKIEKIEINEAENEKTNKEISGLFSTENANDPDTVIKGLKLSDQHQGLGWQSIAISLAIRAILSLPITRCGYKILKDELLKTMAEKSTSKSHNQQSNNSKMDESEIINEERNKKLMKEK